MGPQKPIGHKKGRGCYFAPAPARLFTPLYGAKADALDEAPNLPPGDEAVAVILIEEIDQL